MRVAFTLLFLTFFSISLLPLNYQFVYRGKAYGVHLYCPGGPEIFSKDLLDISLIIISKAFNDTFIILDVCIEVYNSSNIVLYRNSTKLLLNRITREVYRFNGEKIGVTGFYLSKRDIESSNFTVTSFDKYVFYGNVKDRVKLLINGTEIPAYMVSSSLKIDRGILAFNSYYSFDSLNLFYIDGFVVDSILYSLGVFMIALLIQGLSIDGSVHLIPSSGPNILNLTLLSSLFTIVFLILLSKILRRVRFIHGKRNYFH